MEENIEEKKQINLMEIVKNYHFCVLFGMVFCAFLIFFAISSVHTYMGRTKDEINENTRSVLIGVQKAAVCDQMQINSGKPDYKNADASYLDGALFIGDSRTVGLKEYSGWNNSVFFASKGLTIWKVLDADVAEANGQKISVRNALSTQKYDKIYIMLGINEVATGTADSFRTQYKTVIDTIQQLQPQAVIYIQSIMHVTQEKDDKGTYVNNAAIDERNNAIKDIADNVNTYWLDVNEVFDATGTGKLNPEYTSDGVHIKSQYITVWKDYLLSHVIVKK